MEIPPSAAGDVGFGLDVLARFYGDARDRTQNALAAVGGDRQQVDVPNLSASLVPPYKDEVTALGHLMVGRPLDEAEARKVVYDAAFGCVMKELGRH